ncbi:hypothetical protein HDU82_007773 [Entophlyctis luteolus]|nr:hypothetical protein HDU82_007763 [Entophlyctis luteolus]KAJ3212695.1 hypothetical protein HDU82_007773 [Entophlyctis luteolus]
MDAEAAADADSTDAGATAQSNRNQGQSDAGGHSNPGAAAPAGGAERRKRPRLHTEQSEEATTRGKRMFGQLMGKKELKSEKRERKQKQLYEREIRYEFAGVPSMCIANGFRKSAAIAKQEAFVANFIKTETTPHIFFSPAKHNARTQKIVDDQLEAVKVRNSEVVEVDGASRDDSHQTEMSKTAGNAGGEHGMDETSFPAEVVV